MGSDATKLLGLEGVQVTGVELDGDGTPWVMLLIRAPSAEA